MSELASISLQTLEFLASKDGTHQKMVFADAKSNSVGVVLPNEAVREVAAHLMEYVIKLETEGILADDPPASDTVAQPLPASESALLYAKEVDLVRWEGGASVLRVQTTSGVTIHLALNDRHQRYLGHALTASIPPNRSKPARKRAPKM